MPEPLEPFDSGEIGEHMRTIRRDALRVLNRSTWNSRVDLSDVLMGIAKQAMEAADIALSTGERSAPRR